MPKVPSAPAPLVRLGFFLFLLLLCGSAGLLWFFNRPTGLEASREVHIQPGMNARQIGALLAERGLVRSARLFEWSARLQGLAHQLEAGTYRLDGTRSTTSLLQALLKAPVRLRRATIPEGLTRHQIAALLQERDLVDSAHFVALTEDRELARRLGIDAPTLEGYLFPETYYFDEETSAEEVVRRLVGEFHRAFADSLRHRLKAVGLNLHQAVTLASIVEREALVQEERPIIAAIFQRRLRLNLRLESCVTVEYALGVHKKHLSKADLQVRSPYNTYRHRGLPPGPIDSPGRASLLATLYPSPTDYLYFVARGDGHHTFSRTNKEHQAAKRAIRRAARRRARQMN